MAAEHDETFTQLAEFLAAVERRAYRMALIALGDNKAALKVVGATMKELARDYRKLPSYEWGPQFHRMLDQRVRKQLRWQQWTGWLRKSSRDANALLATESSGLTPLQRLDRALAQLSHEERQVFLLRVAEGYDAVQTAKAMDCDDRQAKLHFSHAVIALRRESGT